MPQPDRLNPFSISRRVKQRPTNTACRCSTAWSFPLEPGVKDSITIKVAGEVKGLSEFTLVKITNLIATTWEVGVNHGVSFRAERVEILRAQA